MIMLKLRSDRRRKGTSYKYSYRVYDSGIEIGCIREAEAPSLPQLAWMWSITLPGALAGHVPAGGCAASLALAKTEFLKS
jgi:hypothetical protein